MDMIYSLMTTLLPFDWLSSNFMKNAFLAVLLVTPLFGLISTMVVSNRMAFFSDSLGHGAFTGIAIGVLLGSVSPLLSLVVFSVAFALFITYIKNKSTASTDTIIGVFSATAIALGLMIMSHGGGFNKFSSFLIGDILSITPEDLSALAVVFVLGLIAWGLSHGEGAGTLMSSRPFHVESASMLPLFTGATILCFSFLGFDGLSSLSEETPNAGKVIPRAIVLTALIGGIIFVTVSYSLQLFFPDLARFKEPDAVLPEIALYVGGTLFQSVVLVCTTAAVLASGMAAHAGVSRILYVMGRDRMIPERVFGYIHPTWRTPAINVLLVGALALSAVSFDLDMALALVNFGALVAFTFVNLSVIGQFWVREKRNKSLKEHLLFLVLPLLGAATIGALWINLEQSSLELGLIWAGIGVTYLFLRLAVFRIPFRQYEEAADGQ